MSMKRIRIMLCAALALALCAPCALAENPSDDVSGYNPFDPDASPASQAEATPVLPLATAIPSATALPSSLTDPFGTGPSTGASLTDPFGVGAAPTAVPLVTPQPVTTLPGKNPFDTSAPAALIPANMVMYVTASTLKIVNQPADRARTVTTVAFGEQLNVTATQDNWAQVQTSKGANGYCLMDSLSTSDPNTLNKLMYVQLNQVAMHRSPTTNSGRYRTLRKGDTITLVAVTSDGLWSRVTDGTNFGFCPTIYLDDAPPAEGTIVWCGSASTPVMVNPEGWVQITTLSYGQQVRLVGYVNDNTVAKIRNEKGYVAYCDVAALVTADPANLNMPVYAQATGRVLFSAANDSGRRYNINKNVRLTLLGLDPSQTWALVKQGKRKLYIPYIFVGNARLGQAYRVVVTTADAPLYQTAQQGSAILGTLPAGTRLNLTGGDGMLARVATMSDGVVQSVVGYIALDVIRAE